MNISKYILLFFLIPLQGCFLNFDNLLDTTDEESESVVTEYIWQDDINAYYYYEDDELVRKYLYDYNLDGNCTFIKQTTYNDVVEQSTLYTWEDGNVVQEAVFTSNDELYTYTKYVYDENDRVIATITYNSDLTDPTYTEYTTYSYTGDVITEIKFFDSSGDLVQAFGHELNSDDSYSASFEFDESGDLTAYIEMTYELIEDLAGDYISYKIGYGSSTSSDTFIYSPKSFSFHDSTASSTIDRNTADLISPDVPEDFTLSDPTLDYTRDVDYTWFALWEYDSYGSSKTILDDDYMPVYISRTTPDSLDNIPIIIDISYTEDNQIDTKTTSFNSQTLLELEFEYNSDGFPTTINLSGETTIGSFINFYYNDSNIPEGIELGLGEDVLMGFEYVYGDDVTLATFDSSIEQINQYQGAIGSGEIMVKYLFEYSDLIVDVGITDGDDVATGRIEIGYDVNGFLSYLRSYDVDENKVWDYNYSFLEIPVVDDIYTQVSEYNLSYDEDLGEDVVDTISSFNIETIIFDLKSYIPFDL